MNRRHHICARPAFRVSGRNPRNSEGRILQTQLTSTGIVKHHARARPQMPKIRGAIWVTSIFEAIQVTDAKGGIEFVGPVQHGSDGDPPVDFFGRFFVRNVYFCSWALPAIWNS